MYTGDTQTFTCGVSGVPAPTISYYFNAALITTGVSNGVLTLTNVTNDANTGPYQCFAENVRADSSPLWVVTVREPRECYALAIKLIWHRLYTFDSITLNVYIKI